MSYEAWRISYQSSEQAVSAAAKALSEATNEREADDAQEALEAAAGGDLNGIVENIIQSFLISYNTLPHATQNEFANINAYFDWWKANRREEKQKATDQQLPPTNAGHERQWYRCQACNAVTYRDYIPYSLSNPTLMPACGHWFEDLQAITEQQAITLMKATPCTPC